MTEPTKPRRLLWVIFVVTPKVTADATLLSVVTHNEGVLTAQRMMIRYNRGKQLADGWEEG